MSMGFAAQSQAATLSETIQHSITTNPDVLQAASNRRAIDNELNQANGLYRPQIDFEAAVGPEYSRNSTTRARAARGSGSAGVWMRRATSSLTLQQKIFDGFASKSEQERQAARVDAAAARVVERSEFLALDVAQSYLDVLRNTDIVEQAVQNVESHRRIEDEVRTRVDAGESGVGDLQQAEARVASSRATLVETQRDLEQSIISFRRFVGQEPDDLSRPALNEASIPANVDAAVETTLSQNPTLNLSRADIDVSRAELSASNSNLWPTLDLELIANRNHNTDGTRGPNHDFTGMVVLNYNLYRGGIDVANKSEFHERLAESRERFLHLRRLAEEEVRQSWNVMVKARARAEALADEVLANAQVVATYRQEFEIGQRDLLDLLDSENELFNARVRHMTSDYSAQFNAYRLMAAMGGFIKEMNVSIIEEGAGGSRSVVGETPEWRSEPRAEGL
jgi:adhesin transport system outer membrane protein